MGPVKLLLEVPVSCWGPQQVCPKSQRLAQAAYLALVPLQLM